MNKILSKLFPEELIRVLQTVYWLLRIYRIIPQL